MSDLVRWPPGWSTLLLLPALFAGFTVHELAHGLVAFLLGDTSQVERKRLSLNPLRHVSWVGLIVFLLFGFGWAKPVWIDHRRFRLRNRAFGVFLVSVAGASANLLVALFVFLAIVLTAGIVTLSTGAAPMEVLQYLLVSDPGPDAQGVAVALSYYVMWVNLLLAFFNLLPLPPLDGFQAAVSLVAAIRTAVRGDPQADSLPAQSPGAESGEAVRSPAQIHFDIGLEYHKAGQWDEAIARYRQATEHDDGFALAYYNLGLALWGKERRSLAVSAFRAAARTPGDPRVRAQAELRLHELATIEGGEDLALRPPPPPLEPQTLIGVPEPEGPKLDQAVVRRIWLSMGIGAVGMLMLALAAWVFVTLTALTAFNTML